jgi:hypothetical protein
MKLLPDWKNLLKRAWSIRLMAIAGLLTGLEAIIPLWVDSMPRHTFSMLSMAVITLAMVARLLAQQDIDADEGRLDNEAG